MKTNEMFTNAYYYNAFVSSHVSCKSDYPSVHLTQASAENYIAYRGISLHTFNNKDYLMPIFRFFRIDRTSLQTLIIRFTAKLSIAFRPNGWESIVCDFYCPAAVNKAIRGFEVSMWFYICIVEMCHSLQPSYRRNRCISCQLNQACVT